MTLTIAIITIIILIVLAVVIIVMWWWGDIIIIIIVDIHLCSAPYLLSFFHSVSCCL